MENSENRRVRTLVDALYTAREREREYNEGLSRCSMLSVCTFRFL